MGQGKRRTSHIRGGQGSSKRLLRAESRATEQEILSQKIILPSIFISTPFFTFMLSFLSSSYSFSSFSSSSFSFPSIYLLILTSPRKPCRPTVSYVHSVMTAPSQPASLFSVLELKKTFASRNASFNKDTERTTQQLATYRQSDSSCCVISDGCSVRE